MSANHNDRSQTFGESTFNSLGLEILLFFLPLSRTLGCVHLALYQLPPVLLLQGVFTRPPPDLPPPPLLFLLESPIVSRNLFHDLIRWISVDLMILTMVEISFS